MKPIATAKKQKQLPSQNTPVITGTKLMSDSDCGGFLVSEEYIKTRKKKSKGIYITHAPGNGGDVWIIRHEDNSVAAYLFTEIFDV